MRAARGDSGVGSRESMRHDNFGVQRDTERSRASERWLQRRHARASFAHARSTRSSGRRPTSIVWQRSMDAVREVYRVADRLPAARAVRRSPINCAARRLRFRRTSPRGMRGRIGGSTCSSCPSPAAHSPRSPRISESARRIGYLSDADLETAAQLIAPSRPDAQPTDRKSLSLATSKVVMPHPDSRLSTPESLTASV